MTARADMVAPSAPTRFRSLLRPELGELHLLSEDGSEGDVWRCEECTDGVQHVSVLAPWSGYYEDAERTCENCDGHVWLHGYDDHGRPMPAVPIG